MRLTAPRVRPARPLPWTLLAALVVAGAPALRAQDAEVSLAPVYKQGETLRYKSTAKINAMGNEVVLSDISKVTVKEVKADGSVVIARDRESGTVSIAGMEQALPTSSTEEVRDKQGRLVELKAPQDGLLSPGVAKLAGLMVYPVAPDKKVKPGDKWEIEVDNPAVPAKKLTLKGGFVGKDKLGDAELWKVTQNSEAETDAAGQKMSMEATFWISPTDGQTRKTEVTVKDIPTQFGVLSWTAVNEIVK